MPPTTPHSRLVLASAALIAVATVALPPGPTAGAATTSLRKQSGTPSSIVSPPSSIDATGSVDVTAELNAFLDAQGAGVTVSLPPRAKYRVDGTLVLNDKQDFVLDGNGSRIVAKTTGYRERAHVTLAAGDGVELRELVIRGAHPNAGAEGDYVAQLEAQHGIQVLGTNRAVIRDNVIRDVYGDFVYFGRDQRSKAATFRRAATSSRVVGNRFFGSGRQGIAFTNADQILVEDNVIREVRRSVFDFEPNAQDGSVTNVTIENNTIGLARLNSFAAGGKGRVDDIMIRDNFFDKRPINAMIKARGTVSRANWSFIDNVSNRGFGSTLGGAVWAVGGVKNLRFIGNTQPMNWNRKMAGVQSDDLSCGIVAYGNKLGPYATAQSRGGEQPCAE